ncbi:bifunctional 2-polyprenyl-6-hydroxyphenol methylase/3-demethylubiquinol 3-O-methyltransferase UbiG [Erythrobacteraceae bacterium CFH 75059]|uniref:bifunctional 2-polyprenyl-6-hydroxyphenol methylase/3-demethylubiquinol 3-O-methyltransferase UbiG n=1 Tax=Qipengyuania thermophila TaxID=2509361 RepID=UPI001020394E|nr:bifunctional 2-polyprenyl-6-hydroxyphenol methylase/3-demethylubiquinol 3-O-methyltransferase UbiG [Qipengyuania thermophila]TCD04788.1 bifunctional 2-polyprenyl-6-hydroxyphenol methylase/3-demethylubiquinol 3-O-methyltransferase UbiG [Erythrobacteraceae bacterium CFH 75059]
MSDATIPARTIRPDDAAHFGALAEDWWNPAGSSAMLHRLNPVRLAFIREAIDRHWHTGSADRRPLSGRSALDVGCGAGLLCEPLARLGAEVTGVDAAAENIAAAAVHADASGLAIRYLAGELGTLDVGRFDLVTALEVIEHTADKPAFLRAVCDSVAPDGLLIVSTPNRTAASALLLAGAAEWTGMIPRGTHRWRDFMTPDELKAMLAEQGLDVMQSSGIAFDPARGLHLSDSMALNFIVAARRPTGTCTLPTC